MRRDKLLYLAVADARGHLMRAHLVRGLLARDGVQVDVVTTTAAGQAFLASLGTPSQLISDGFRIVFAEAHRLSPGRTERRVLRYLLGRQARLDLDRLTALAGDGGLLVVDSLHPAVLAAPLLGRRSLPVVHVFGANLLEATREHARRRLPGSLGRWFERQLDLALDRAVGCVVHSLAVPATPSRAGQETLPPLLAPPGRTRAEVRATLGLAEGQRLAALYLNPHLDDPALARMLEESLAAAGYRWAGVSEPFAGRAGWTATDPRFTDLVAASDLLVSGAGMAACGLVQTCRRPFLCLLGAQPEQQRNLADLRSGCGIGAPAVESVALGQPPGSLRQALEAALTRLAAGAPVRAEERPGDGFAATAERWRQTLLRLMARAELAAAPLSTPVRRRTTDDPDESISLSR